MVEEAIGVAVRRDPEEKAGILLGIDVEGRDAGRHEPLDLSHELTIYVEIPGQFAEVSDTRHREEEEEKEEEAT